MAQFDIQPLTPETWPHWASLVEANDGVWGGCWCVAFHAEGARKFTSADEARETKQALVARGAAHAALVLDAGEVVGWCQYGRSPELPRIKNKRAYEQGLATLPDWRITCFFTGKGHRGTGVAEAGLLGALDLIAQAGGGTVEGYPEDVAGRKVSGSFLWNGTLGLFERNGFTRDRQIGKYKWVMRRDVAPS